MKNVINYYYNIYPENIFQNNKEYYFFINNIRYSFIEYKEDIQVINNIYNMHLNILRKKMYVHPIILNKEKKTLTYVNNKPYILLQTLYYDSKITIESIIQFSKISSNELSETDWPELWANKNDYLEYQIKIVGKKHPKILESSNYFFGMAETAIQLTTTVKNIKQAKVYTHKRINKDSTTFDLYNPLNIKIDLKVRDAAEYFKESFFNGEEIEKELTYYFNNSRLNTYEYIMFLARMLYPTYYFDIVEEIITEKEDENKIINIINRIDKYEQLLKKIYQFYKRFTNIISIEWLE